jgi:lipopolysaccharide biosynthesis protein
MTASAHDKQAIKAKWRAVFNDKVDVSVADLGRERLIANPSKVYYRLVVSMAQLKDNMKADMSNITIAKFNTWKDANLDNPNHFQIAVGNDWRQTLTDAGLEPVPQPDPMP